MKQWHMLYIFLWSYNCDISLYTLQNKYINKVNIWFNMKLTLYSVSNHTVHCCWQWPLLSSMRTHSRPMQLMHLTDPEQIDVVQPTYFCSQNPAQMLHWQFIKQQFQVYSFSFDKIMALAMWLILILDMEEIYPHRYHVTKETNLPKKLNEKKLRLVLKTSHS